MTTSAVHRHVEQQAARRPDVIAIRDGGGAITYSDLNHRANRLARQLINSGLTRGSVATVTMERCADLAVVLLAILKAGASYCWMAPHETAVENSGDRFPTGLAIRRSGRHGGEDEYLALDLRRALADCSSQAAPNLPILTRGSEIACVLPDGSQAPHVLVPHETIARLPAPPAPRAVRWSDDPGAFDLWLALMSGATLTLDQAPSTAAA